MISKKEKRYKKNLEIFQFNRLKKKMFDINILPFNNKNPLNFIKTLFFLIIKCSSKILIITACILLGIPVK